MIATDGDPVSTIINGGNNGIVITVNISGSGLFTLDGFTIQNGLGDYLGGGILFEYDFVGIVNIKNNIIKDNYANTLGGGLYSWQATGSVSRNIFINNFCGGDGNAARLNVGGINFYNNTLWENDASLFVRSSDHRIINNIVWDNDDHEFIRVNENPTIEYNIVKNGYDGTGNISDDPQFYDPDNGDFRLGTSSPAIDAGDPDLDGDGEDYSTDEDDQDPDGTRMDIGAYTLQLYTIADARALDLGVAVTVEGVVTTHNGATSTTFYGIQDNTAGIRFYLGDTLLNFQLGDELRIAGTLTDYNSLLEILPGDASDIFVVSQNNPLPDYQLLTMQQYLANGESYESELIRFSDVGYMSGDWPVEGSSSGIVISDDEGATSLTMFLDSAPGYSWQAQPFDPFFVSGIADQYNDSYQIRPQDYHDFSTTIDAGFENSFRNINPDWQNLPTFWEWSEQGGLEFLSFHIEPNGAPVYESDSIFYSYDGSYSLKMWGQYSGGENMEGNIFQTYQGENALETWSKMKVDAQIMSHQDDWIGDGTNSVALFAKYFTDGWDFIASDYSAHYDGTFEWNIWHPMSLEFTVPEGAEIVQIGVTFFQADNDQPGAVYIDNLTAFQIPRNIDLSTSLEHIVHGDTGL
ncbi:MAG TPA: hypothetical protein EYO18_06870, partial [Candidatus Marinimicrobia bacterium]|nr:hypothetical protein [Candidatus Neomarinimicrobiota bacterium]